MKATITIEKSFDENKKFGKEWEDGDIEEFLKDEGAYLDRLCKTLETKGVKGDEFTVTYVVNVRK